MHRVVMRAPVLDDRVSLVQGLEDFSFQPFIPELTSVTPTCRSALYSPERLPALAILEQDHRLGETLQSSLDAAMRQP